jgi:hypothetical protein
MIFMSKKEESLIQKAKCGCAHSVAELLMSIDGTRAYIKRGDLKEAEDSIHNHIFRELEEIILDCEIPIIETKRLINSALLNIQQQNNDQAWADLGYARFYLASDLGMCQSDPEEMTRKWKEQVESETQKIQSKRERSRKWEEAEEEAEERRHMRAELAERIAERRKAYGREIPPEQLKRIIEEETERIRRRRKTQEG